MAMAPNNSRHDSCLVGCTIMPGLTARTLACLQIGQSIYLNEITDYQGLKRDQFSVALEVFGSSNRIVPRSFLALTGYFDMSFA